MNQTNLPKRPSYKLEIDGLRAVAVLSVVIFHAFPSSLQGGFIGVDVFFVISGFLITGHIFESLDSGRFSFLDFFARRIRRIFPALIIVCLACLAVGWFVLLADEYNQLGKHVAGGAAFIVNFMLADEAGYFDNAAETKLMLHLWSLAVEEQFYIIWPLVLWFAWKRGTKLITVTLVVAGISFLLNLNYAFSKPIETFFWPFSRFWELLCGSILAWVMLYRGDKILSIEQQVTALCSRKLPFLSPEQRQHAFANIVSTFGLLLIIASAVFLDKRLAFPSYWAVFPVLGAILVILAGAKAWVARIVLMHPIATWFGLISYPLYLWHWPVLTFLRIVEGETVQLELILIAVAISIGFAWITYKFIENPIRFGALKKINALYIMMCLIMTGVIGFWLSNKDLSDSHGFRDVLHRDGFQHIYGDSTKWYQGKDDWIFLGNEYDSSVAKLKMAQRPNPNQILETIEPFKHLAAVADKYGIDLGLIIGPNKASVYPEYLPQGLIPSKNRYISFFTNELEKIPGLVVYDPTEDLISKKDTEGMLYWRTDSHWNYKGAFLAFEGFAEKLRFPAPKLEFIPGPLYTGDFIRQNVFGIDEFPISQGDHWLPVWTQKPNLHITDIKGDPKTPFGDTQLIDNSNPLSNQKVWVIGDSFAGGLKQYFNGTFRQVRYLGHWHNGNLNKYAAELSKADEKPDLVIVVRVERTF